MKQTKKNIALILKGLEELYPNPKPELNFTNPFETLVATILSAQCTDKQVNKTTPKVFALYPDAFKMAECTFDELYPLVRSCGFASKAKNIIETSKILVEKYNGEVPQTMEDLVQLPGVGRKTANVVMANAFNIPAIAVDTHVFRVSNRLKLANAKNVEDTEKQLMKNIPKEDWKDAHHWLILHGRRVCTARNPKCNECTLNKLCPHYLEQK
ncbi:MAG: endonuclease III [Christensenellaceae bacterium]|nr:endonuclease III [Christensenellaceae bacterium]